jgi:hypothetical protein
MDEATNVEVLARQLPFVYLERITSFLVASWLLRSTTDDAALSRVVRMCGVVVRARMRRLWIFVHVECRRAIRSMCADNVGLPGHLGQQRRIWKPQSRHQPRVRVDCKAGSGLDHRDASKRPG